MSHESGVVITESGVGPSSVVRPPSSVAGRRLRALLALGLAAAVVALAIRIVSTGIYSRWQASRMSDSALSRAVASPRAGFAVVLESARRLERDGRFPSAEAAYQRAVKLDPACQEAWTGWGRSAFAAGSWGQAERILRHEVEEWPNNAEARFVLSGVLASTLRPRAAVDQLEAGLKQDPGRPDPCIALGQLQMTLGHPHEAVEAFGRASRLAPNRAAIHAPYGAALLADGRLKEARKELETALKVDPSDMESRYHHGAALVRTGTPEDHVDGMKELTRVAEFWSRRSRAYVEAAKMWQRDGDYGDAEQALEHAVDADGTDLEALRMLIAAYERNGRKAVAAEFREKLRPLEALDQERTRVKGEIESGGGQVQPLLRLGQIDLALHDREEARSAFAAVLGLDPGNKTAVQGLMKLAKS